MTRVVPSLPAAPAVLAILAALAPGGASAGDAAAAPGSTARLEREVAAIARLRDRAAEIGALAREGAGPATLAARRMARVACAEALPPALCDAMAGTLFEGRAGTPVRPPE